MKNYDHKKIEKKLQNFWQKKGIYKAHDNSKKKKFYALIEFPYPSGDGLHVGHIRSNTAMDIISRKRRMEGYNVLYPIGWDAFGLPTENYAIKTGKKPAVVTKKNTDTFRRQLKELGFSFDWSREINTTDPKYYKWTQWIFLQFFKKGLAYKAKSFINWCPSCKIGLANEEAVGGVCDRCGSATEKKEKEQWMLAITKYADRLYKDLDLVDYPERVKIQQRNWIGKSEGSEIEFRIFGGKRSFLEEERSDGKGETLRSQIKVFTTRADTIFGATYLVLAPEHESINNLKLRITNWWEVEEYIKNTKKKSELERIAEDKVKTGIELKGIKAINPANNEEIPVWIADYVLPDYGTGAIMAVPEHDSRDKEFAEKYNLPIVDKPLADALEITKKVGGKMVTKFKLRDWVFSRQRYWGEPIPMVYCENCADLPPTPSQGRGKKKSLSFGEGLGWVNAGWIPVPEKDLPVKLPEVKNYKTTDTGESPLAGISKWVNTKCPKCKGSAKRETDTMPNWAGSSWYYLRYTDPKNNKVFADKKKLKYWLTSPRPSPKERVEFKVLSFGEGLGGVDWYNGGMEHTTLHLLYSRFWHKFLYDLKLVPTVEPYQKRTSHGMILGEGGVKMSKSLGNVINPDSIVRTYGADTLRIYEMFIGPFEDAVAWNTDSIIGSRRFLEKVWRIGEKIINQPTPNPFPRKGKVLSLGEDLGGVCDSSPLGRLGGVKLLHKTIKKVSEDIENMRFNTAISAMMILATEMEKPVSKGTFDTFDTEDFKKFLQILAPFAPHITEELWQQIHTAPQEKPTPNPFPRKGKVLSLGEDLGGVCDSSPLGRLGGVDSIHFSSWPKWDENLVKDDEIKIAVQVNGKVRAEIVIQADEEEKSVQQKALMNENVLRHLAGRTVKKVIYIKNRVINIIS